MLINRSEIGAWRSLVAHLLWEQGVGGSNPLAPIGHDTLVETGEHGCYTAILLSCSWSPRQEGGGERSSVVEHRVVVPVVGGSNPLAHPSH